MFTLLSLSTVWKLGSYVSDVYRTYEEYYDYLEKTEQVPFDKDLLPVGTWVSRSMEQGFWNTGVLAYTQHHGVIVGQDGEVSVAHFQDNKIKKSSLKEYMNGERVLHVYKTNPLATLDIDLSPWEGHYNLVIRNCEHFASMVVEGAARSRQIEVLEHIAWNALWRSHPLPPDSLKLMPKVSLYV